MRETTTKASRWHAALEQARSGRKPFVLDGAVGTELDNRGADTRSAAWSGLASVTAPDLLSGIHRDYVAAGAMLLTANTFRTTRRAFERAGVSGITWQDAARAAVEIAREASNGVLVAGSIAPLEDCFSPKDAPLYPEAFTEHCRLCEVLVAAGVDILWLETFGTLHELSAAIDSAKSVGEGRVPFAVSVTTSKNGRLISGEPLSKAVQIAAKRGAVAFSINCIPTPHVPAALRIIKNETSLPIGVYANLGVPEATQDWNGSAYLAPVEYARIARTWDVAMVGGCCGSTPEHIRAIGRM